MCNNQTKEYTNYHYEARIRNQRDFYIDKENMIQYVNELEGIKEQSIPEFDNERFENIHPNSMLKFNSDLYYEWDFKKNDELRIDIWKLKKGSKTYCWWICNLCGSSYYTTPYKRKESCKCTYCFGKSVNHTNSLASRNPELASQWHPTLNGNLTPNDVQESCCDRVMWLGECGHPFPATVSRRSKGKGCIYCVKKNPKVLVGFNDMWTTNPDLAKLLANPEDGYELGEFSNKKNQLEMYLRSIN